MTPVTKILVAGPFGAGKTTFVATAGDDVLRSESVVSDDTVRLKEQTTVAMDHATARIQGARSEHVVTLFGTPGQERFSFMWPMLAQGMAAYILVLDASRLQSRAQLKAVVRRFADFAPEVPFVVAANRWDPSEVPAQELADFVGVPASIIVPCDPRDPAEVRGLLRTILDLLEGAQEGARS